MGEKPDYSCSVQSIPYTIKLFNKNEFYKVRLENVYDPSKFWLVIKYNELILFTKYLTAYYNRKTRKMPIPRSKLKHGLTCIILKNSKYYRAILLPIILPEKNKFRVFMVDYGLTVNVDINDVFYIFKKHCDVPRFSVRATLAYISPANQLEPWCTSDLRHFCQLVSEKDLAVKVMEIDPSLKILHVEIIRVNNGIGESVNALLVKYGIGSYSQHIRDIKKDPKYRRKLKYMHLFPSFDALEGGVVPSSLWEQNLLKSIPSDLLYKDYFEYQYEESP